jgi:hypothetical protein
MANIHMVLQGKGGVGKSFIAAVLAQYMNAMGKKPLCIDTDPVNAIFHGYKALNVQRLEIMEGDEINPRHFDALVEMFASSSRMPSSTMGQAPSCRCRTTSSPTRCPQSCASSGTGSSCMRWSREAKRCAIR